MNHLPTGLRTAAQRLLALLLGILVVIIGEWSFPIFSHRPLIASHVLIGIVVVLVLLPLCAWLLFAVPDARARRDIQHPTPRQTRHESLAVTHRQRRRVER